MSKIKVGQENSTPIEIYYEDHGSGKPVVLIHGWPLSGASWEKQVAALLADGRRVITYDRRGFGRSSQPSTGYDYDTFASDLNILVTHLDLKDFDLVGFSMGTGEVTRYLGRYGSALVSKAVMIGVVPPYLLKTDDNPAGVPAEVFEDIKKNIVADRPAFLTEFFKNFYNLDVNLGKRISEQVVQLSWNVASGASAKGTLDCVTSWLTDFRDDVANIDVPTLILHGDEDRILPIESTAVPLSKLIAAAKFVKIEGGPHGMCWTHADKINVELLSFFNKETEAATA